MGRVAAQGPAQHRHALALGIDAATDAMGQGYHAVDMGIGLQRLGVDVSPEVVGHCPRHRRRAIHRGEDTDVVAGRHPTIGTDDAPEAALDRHRRATGLDAEGMLPGEVAHGEVVHVDVAARGDGLPGEADDLTIASYRLAHRYRTHGNLVTGRHRFANPHPLLRQFQARYQWLAGDEHIVLGMQAQGGAGGRRRAATGDQFHVRLRFSIR